MKTDWREIREEEKEEGEGEREGRERERDKREGGKGGERKGGDKPIIIGGKRREERLIRYTETLLPNINMNEASTWRALPSEPGVGEAAYLVWPVGGGGGSSGQFRGHQTARPARGEVVSGSLG